MHENSLRKERICRSAALSNLSYMKIYSRVMLLYSTKNSCLCSHARRRRCYESSSSHKALIGWVGSNYAALASPHQEMMSSDASWWCETHIPAFSFLHSKQDLNQQLVANGTTLDFRGCSFLRYQKFKALATNISTKICLCSFCFLVLFFFPSYLYKKSRLVHCSDWYTVLTCGQVDGSAKKEAVPC